MFDWAALARWEPQKGQWSCNQICFSRSINYISVPFLRLRQLDMEFMKHLSRVVNIIPVIAKSDTLTLDEKTEFKQKVLMKTDSQGDSISS